MGVEMQIPITINRSIDANKLYNVLLQSNYMKKRGYAILYSSDYGQGNYGLCYFHDSDLIYIHIRILAADLPNTFRYFITLGERKHKNQIDTDLKNLTNEVETSP